MGPELSRQLGKILGTYQPTLQERLDVIEAAENVETWEELPAATKKLLQQIKDRANR